MVLRRMVRFQVKLGLVRGKYLPAGLHAVEASYVSASSLGACRAANVRSVWSSKMPLANTPVVTNLLDAPIGVDPAFYLVWTRFRLVRRYLAQQTLKVSRNFRMQDLIAHGALVMGLCICFIGFVWDGDERGWMALQAYWLGHLGVDNLNVVRSIARLLEHGKLSKPLSNVNGGDLIAIVQSMMSVREPETVRITKVEWYATDADVEQGRVRAEDKLGNMEADFAADYR